jgi:alanyl-tRNA synthetase
MRSSRVPSRSFSIGAGAFLVVANEDSGIDLGAVSPEICSILEGRGGGRAPFFQGKAAGLGRRDQAIERLMTEISP